MASLAIGNRKVTPHIDRRRWGSEFESTRRERVANTAVAVQLLYNYCNALNE
jgi:hypothetical protein